MADTPEGNSNLDQLRAKAARVDELEKQIAERDRQIRELELELAQTKLALVESECQTQDLTHQLNAALNEVSTAKNTWFQKTLTSIRDVTAKKDAKDEIKDKEVH